MSNFATEVTLEEAKADLESLCARAAKGERITIVCGDNAIADLAAHYPTPSKEAPEELRAVIEKMKKFRERQTLGGIDWRELRDEGRR